MLSFNFCTIVVFGMGSESMFLQYFNIFCFRNALICSGEENMYNCLINFEYITNITKTTNCLDYHSMPSSNNGVIQGIM